VEEKYAVIPAITEEGGEGQQAERTKERVQEQLESRQQGQGQQMPEDRLTQLLQERKQAREGEGGGNVEATFSPAPSVVPDARVRVGCMEFSVLMLCAIFLCAV
jgi:hypothetical protein